MLNVTQIQNLTAKTAPSRQAMAEAAAADVAERLRTLLASKPLVRMVFAAAPSQAEMLRVLQDAPGIDWWRLHVFNMDEYIGLPADHPAAFGPWLRRHFFDHVPLGSVQLIEPGATPELTSVRYAGLLAAGPIDIVCLGIGANGHIAFNDPPVADFTDPLDVKVVELDAACRQQQVDEDCFASIDLVPTHAITLTIPRLMAASQLICTAPGAIKRQAVHDTLHGLVTTACPASILRTHPNCTLYLDKESNPDG
jgi:glucosamine-6-phosphate deaminase